MQLNFQLGCMDTATVFVNLEQDGGEKGEEVAGEDTMEAVERGEGSFVKEPEGEEETTEGEVGGEGEGGEGKKGESENRERKEKKPAQKARETVVVVAQADESEIQPAVNSEVVSDGTAYEGGTQYSVTPAKLEKEEDNSKR